jgi:hypothetical protein
MQELYSRDGVRFFVFQDDDFAAKTLRQRQWLEAFLDALRDAGLVGQVTWKLSCRVDEVNEDVLGRCRDHGLIAVFLGVESGSPSGLRALNKRVTVGQNRAAIETLRRLGIAFEMGFMLFDPDTTFETIRENIDFLRWVTADGSCPANFCKMLPYAGTPIEDRLRREGRLKGPLSQPDYDFLDARLDWFALFAARVFRFRNFDDLGLVERLRTARIDQILVRAFELSAKVEEYEAALRRVTARASSTALDTLESGLGFVADRDVEGIQRDWPLLGHLVEREWQAEIELQQELDAVLAVHNPDLLQAHADEFSRRLSQGTRTRKMGGHAPASALDRPPERRGQHPGPGRAHRPEGARRQVALDIGV